MVLWSRVAESTSNGPDESIDYDGSSEHIAGLSEQFLAVATTPHS